MQRIASRPLVTLLWTVALAWTACCFLPRVALAQAVLTLQLEPPREAPGLVINRRVADLALRVLQERLHAAGGTVRPDPDHVDRLLLEIPRGSKQPWPWWQQQVTMRGRLQFKVLRPDLDTKKDEWVTILAGDYVTKSGVARNDADQPIVWFNLDDEGRRRFAEITARLVGKPIAICLDERVLSTPIVREPITNGRAEIFTGGSQEAADEIVTVLNARITPCEIKILPRKATPPELPHNGASPRSSPRH